MKLGLDIGGSKCVALIVDDCGNVDRRILRGAFGLASDTDEVSPHFYDALSSLNIEGRITKISVNLGGKNVGEIRKTLHSHFPDAECDIYRESEGVTAQQMMRALSANIVIMAGTGCIAFGEGRRARCVVGGWGKEIGDRGCGYSLGMSAIQQTLLELDSARDTLSPIASRLSGRDTPFLFTDITEYAAARDAVRQRLPRERGEVAALVPEIVACAEAGCPTSISLIARAGREIADGAISVAEKIGEREISVVINGGMTAFAQLWRDAFTERIGEARLTLTSLEITNNAIEKTLLYMLGEEK